MYEYMPQSVRLMYEQRGKELAAEMAAREAEAGGDPKVEGNRALIERRNLAAQNKRQADLMRQPPVAGPAPTLQEPGPSLPPPMDALPDWLDAEYFKRQQKPPTRQPGEQFGPDISLRPSPQAAPEAVPAPVEEDPFAAALARINSTYPKFNYEPTEADLAVDANLAKEKERTRLLAQLALSAGITGAGGEMFAPVAKGLAAAGGVYDDGFRRYHQALENRAKQVMARRENQYKDDFKRTELASGLALEERKMKLDAAQKEQDRWEDFFKTYKVDPKPNDMGVTDPQLFEDFKKMRERHERYRTTGNPHDVTGK